MGDITARGVPHRHLRALESRHGPGYTRTSFALEPPPLQTSLPGSPIPEPLFSFPVRLTTTPTTTMQRTAACVLQAPEQGWTPTIASGIGTRASRSIAPLSEVYEPCTSQCEMVKILTNATFETREDDATRVADFIKGMVSVTCRTMLNRALLDSEFASWGPTMLHAIFRQVTKDKNPAPGSRSIPPKDFRYSTTEVVRKATGMNARGDSKASHDSLP